ncbi:MAG: hypothetical protein NTZ17_20590 [Phycisphaerae bacterium]|nr:hypothetical protein [Phycisphaerae bacterium]
MMDFVDGMDTVDKVDTSGAATASMSSASFTLPVSPGGGKDLFGRGAL